MVGTNSYVRISFSPMKVVQNKEGERYVIVHDAEHSLLYR